jgi:hypothetical protein
MTELIKCPTCAVQYEHQPEKCDSCGFPFAGTDTDRSRFIAQQILKRGKISDTKDSIKKARTILFVIAGFNIIVPFFRYTNVQFGGIMIAITVFIGLIFLLFGLLAKKHPMVSVLVPLVMLVFFYAVEGIVSPGTIFRGLLWKAIFIGGLGYALYNIIEAEKIKRESRHLASNDYK